MRELTAKQKQVLDFIVSRVRESGIPPTLREISEYFGFSSLASPRHHLDALDSKGYISLKKGASRGIELKFPAGGIPVLGDISAGDPRRAFENIEGYLNPQFLSAGGDLFCLRVKGDSMSGAGIMQGDIVVVRKQSSADTGSIVAAVIEDEALVKKLKKRGKETVLAAENPAYPDISVKNARVLGKVVGVVRDYEQIWVY